MSFGLTASWNTSLAAIVSESFCLKASPGPSPRGTCSLDFTSRADQPAVALPSSKLNVFRVFCVSASVAPSSTLAI